MRRTLWMLALAAGYVDGLALLHLGGVFASVVTGNLVVVGIAAAADPQRITGAAVRAALAVAGYAATVALARRLPPARCLVAELLALCTLCGGWVVARHDPHGLVQLPLLTLATIATGLQAAALRDAEIPTTYLTGTLTRLAGGRLDPLLLVPLIAVPAGAAGAALLLDRAPWLGPLPAVALVAAACVGHAAGPPRPPRSPAAAEHRQAAFTP